MLTPAEINPAEHLNQGSSYTDGTATWTGNYICIYFTCDRSILVCGYKEHTCLHLRTCYSYWLFVYEAQGHEHRLAESMGWSDTSLTITTPITYPHVPDRSFCLLWYTQCHWQNWTYHLGISWILPINILDGSDILDGLWIYGMFMSLDLPHQFMVKQSFFDIRPTR